MLLHQTPLHKKKMAGFGARRMDCVMLEEQSVQVMPMGSVWLIG